jgi:hypothetical protein
MGFSRTQIEQIMGEKLKKFDSWMRGQTQAICDGRQYNFETKEYEPAACTEPHGWITYVWDTKDFLAGRPVTD